MAMMTFKFYNQFDSYEEERLLKLLDDNNFKYDFMSAVE